jgi:ribosomal protein S19E (S16A)
MNTTQDHIVDANKKVSSGAADGRGAVGSATAGSVWATGAHLESRPTKRGWWYDRKNDLWRKMHSHGEISDGEYAARWSVTNYPEEKDRWWGPIRPTQNMELTGQ